MNPRRSPVEVRLPPHGVYVWETQHDHGFRMDTESHDFAELFYVLDGSGSFVIDDREHTCGPGDVVLVPPGAAHAIEDHDSPLTLYGIGVASELLAYDPEIVRRARAGWSPARERSAAASAPAFDGSSTSRPTRSPARGRSSSA